MFDPTSRYFPLQQGTVPVAGSDEAVRQVAYVRRRFIPPLEHAVVLAEHGVVQGDRLDNLTARYLGDPLQFWRICDANLEMFPPELTDEPGETITIPLPTH